MAAIATDNGKLAVMEWDLDWEPGLPLSPGAFGQEDQQQLLWGFPEILWAAAIIVLVGAPVRGLCSITPLVDGTVAIAAEVVRGFCSISPLLAGSVAIAAEVVRGFCSISPLLAGSVAIAGSDDN